ncbi:MAG: M23 family metallopeptidase [Rhodospirillales bacterium]|nr:M23 family metallopeptidase [Rhodospirillales bacterium]
MALATTVFLSAGVILDDADGHGIVTTDSQPENISFSLAPLSLGNPVFAASSMVQHWLMPNESARELSFPGINVTGPLTQTLTAKHGDTLAGMLVDAGVSNEDANVAMQALGSVYNSSKIRLGQEISLLFEPTVGPDAGADRFYGLGLAPDLNREITVTRDSDGGFRAREEKRILLSTMTGTSGEITSSLYLAGVKAGVPQSVLASMIRSFSWDVDFQRDIRPGDRFEVMYENFLDTRGTAVKSGKIVFASLTLSGNRLQVYLHETPEGRREYFDDKGQSIQKALLRTPIDGARLSSGFGRRKHPILGYTKMHRGTDFAAPRGTPIYAAGNGTIEFSGRNGAYGNYVRIRHNGSYATAYAHMNRIAKGMRQGTRVTQGEIVGYVGTTGRSTGPHLHYEILLGGRQTNPMKVKMPSGRKLKGNELKYFLTVKARIDRQFATIARETNVASNR